MILVFYIIYLWMAMIVIEFNLLADIDNLFISIIILLLSIFVTMLYGLMTLL